MHTEDFAMFIDAGFIAVKQGNRLNAERLFLAAQALKPEHSAPALGFGYIALHSLHLAAAKNLFEAVLKKEPQNPFAKVLLGFSYLMGKTLSAIQKQEKGKSQAEPADVDAQAVLGEKLVREAMAESKDEGVQSLGKAALEMLTKVSALQSTPVR